MMRTTWANYEITLNELCISAGFMYWGSDSFSCEGDLWELWRSLQRINAPDQGPVSRKPRKLFGAVKPFFVHLYVKKEEVYTPETSCMKWISPHIKKMWIKQLCNRKVRDFALALRARKVSGAFEKRAPVYRQSFCYTLTLFLLQRRLFILLLQAKQRWNENIVGLND